MGRLLVDAYNVIRRDAALRDLERRDPLAARAELLCLLGHHSLSRYEVVAVFDGVPAPQERPPQGSAAKGRPRAYFSREQSADELIEAMSGPGDVVVTDDRGLAASTLEAGPQVWSVEKLLARVRPPKRSAPRDAPAEDAPALRYPRLRRFEVCPRCLFRERDDWVMLCEEDSALGRPHNFRERW